MDPTRFDRISRLFADRRLSRRSALAVSGAGIATAALGVAASAQDATPVASPAADADKVSFLFVQTFGAGEISDPGNGNLILTADHLTGQTIYFSDRPERIVGTVSTAKFLGEGSGSVNEQATASPEAGLDFTPVDPPNAALVFDSAAGSDEPGDVLVVELIDPTYDPATRQATYEIKVLADDTAIDMSFVSEPVAKAEAIRAFEGASLFIDDCKDASVACYNPDGAYLGSYPIGACYNYLNVCCQVCNSGADFAGMCAQYFGERCGDACVYAVNGSPTLPCKS